MPDNEEIIRLEEVFKIFGPQPRGRAFDLARSGMHKNDVQQQSGHVVGLCNVSFSIKKGEIYEAGWGPRPWGWEPDTA